ncbi:hypothetical protein CLF_104205 [Clonorchis sinensis]|uniref:Uncharacterized protein n=1 Tax=Clonorchis sinensis TaxID=79923 RepID=G7YNT2_CLOSI|nr:hypothetical protein CLF_104205 [Clonorchis sinensis]
MQLAVQSALRRALLPEFKDNLTNNTAIRPWKVFIYINRRRSRSAIVRLPLIYGRETWSPRVHGIRELKVFDRCCSRCVRTFYGSTKYPTQCLENAVPALTERDSHATGYSHCGFLQSFLVEHMIFLHIPGQCAIDLLGTAALRNRKNGPHTYVVFPNSSVIFGKGVSVFPEYNGFDSEFSKASVQPEEIVLEILEICVNSVLSYGLDLHIQTISRNPSHRNLFGNRCLSY